MSYPSAPVDAATFLATGSATDGGVVVAVEIGANERSCTVHGRLFSLGSDPAVDVHGIARVNPDSGEMILAADNGLLGVVLSNNRIELSAPSGGTWFGSLRLEFCPL